MHIRKVKPSNIDKHTKGRDLILVISSQTCFFCKTLKQKFLKLPREISDRILVYEIDITEHEEWQRKNEIYRVPQMWIYRNGERTHIIYGDVEDIEDLIEIITTYLLQ